VLRLKGYIVKAPAVSQQFLTSRAFLIFTGCHLLQCVVEIRQTTCWWLWRI